MGVVSSIRFEEDDNHVYLTEVTPVFLFYDFVTTDAVDVVESIKQMESPQEMTTDSTHVLTPVAVNAVESDNQITFVDDVTHHDTTREYSCLPSACVLS